MAESAERLDLRTLGSYPNPHKPEGSNLTCIIPADKSPQTTPTKITAKHIPSSYANVNAIIAEPY
jgi:hypothetical protein